jgi:hypothetical protein
MIINKWFVKSCKTADLLTCSTLFSSGTLRTAPMAADLNHPSPSWALVVGCRLETLKSVRNPAEAR